MSTISFCWIAPFPWDADRECAGSADTTLIPVQAQYLPQRSGTAFADRAKVRRQINPKLKIEGILLTMTDSRTNYGQQIDNLIRGAYGSKIKVFDQTIPGLSVLRKSVLGKSIFQHDPKGKVAEAYKSLTEEVMANAERQLKRVAERADDIFSTEESRQEQQREQVQQIPIGELFPSRIIL